MGVPHRELGRTHSRSLIIGVCDCPSAHVEGLVWFSHPDCVSDSPEIIGKHTNTWAPPAEVLFQLV